jgi:DNA-binding transcriptional LysR family regulator
MNNKSLRAFRLIVERGSLSAAAAALNLSQPAVSRLVAMLEGELNLTLFNRTGRSLRMTKEGAAFYDATKHLLAGLDEIPSIAKDILAGDRQFRLITTQRIAKGLIAPALALMRRENPAVHCAVDVLSRIELDTLVGMRRFDLGIASLPVKHALVDIENEPIFRVRAEAVVPKDHPLADREKVTAADLAGHDLVGLWQDQLWRQQMNDFLRSGGKTGQFVVETRSSMMACQLAGEGVGIAFLDRLSAHGLDLSRVRLVPLEPARWMAFGAIHHRDQPLTANALKFMDCVRRTTAEFRARSAENAAALELILDDAAAADGD